MHVESKTKEEKIVTFVMSDIKKKREKNHRTNKETMIVGRLLWGENLWSRSL